MIDIFAKDYSTRDSLEQAVIQAVGATSDPKNTHRIVGTRTELKTLGLSDLRSVYGVRCVVTDTPTDTKKKGEKVDRGEIIKPSVE